MNFYNKMTLLQTRYLLYFSQSVKSWSLFQLKKFSHKNQIFRFTASQPLVPRPPSPSYSLCPSGLQLNFFSNLAWKQCSFLYTHIFIITPSIIFAVFVDQFSLLQISTLHFSWANECCLRRPYVLLHCIHYKCLRPVKAKLSVLLSNPWTSPSIIPLPTPHQCCCKCLFFQPPTPMSTSYLFANELHHLPCREYRSHEVEFSPIAFLSLSTSSLHSAYYKISLLLIL